MPPKVRNESSAYFSPHEPDMRVPFFKSGITGASVSLLRSIRFSAGDNSRFDQSRVCHSSFSSSDGGFPIKGKDKGRVTLSFPVPSDLKPTLRGKLIEVTYVLNVAIKFPGSSDEQHIPERSKRVWVVRKDMIEERINPDMSQRGAHFFSISSANSHG
jgi:hypothetical protein